MLIRSIAKAIRGRATPFQLLLAATLGAMIGFVPGFSAAPGLLVFLTLLLIFLNANLGVAAIVGAGAKLASLLLVPISFSVGRILLDGPTQPLFKWAINAPVLALFGFDRYLTTGAAFMGLVVGLLVGTAIVMAVNALRRKLAGLEEGSEAYKKVTSKGWAKLAVFLLVGKGHGKKTYAQILEKKFGNPIRPLGAIFVVLVLGILWIAQQFASGPILAAALERGLEQANGATVDLADAKIDLKEGKLNITGLAMADPNNLKTDLFRAATLEADISGADLLRRRIGLDRVVMKEASSGEARRVAGRLVGPPPVPSEAPPAEKDEKSIEDYIKQAKEWKERLAQVRKWLEQVSGGDQPVEGAPGEPQETLRERLEREIREKGYANVTADHLIEGAPTFLLRELIAEGVTVTQLEGEVFDIKGVNLSTQPHLVEGAAKVEVRSRSGNLVADVALAGSAGEAAGASGLNFFYKGIPADTIGSAMAIGGQAPMQGGTIDIALNGAWEGGRVGYIKMPLDVTLRDTTLGIAGGSAKVKEFTLPIGLRGPIDNPRIMVNADRLADSLVKAGAGQLVQKGEEEAKKAIDKAAGSALEKAAGGALGGLLGGKKEEPKDKKPE